MSSYVVTAYDAPGGNPTRTVMAEKRTHRIQSAISWAATLAPVNSEFVATIRTTGKERELIGSMNAGKFRPAKAYEQHRKGTTMTPAPKLDNATDIPRHIKDWESLLSLNDNQIDHANRAGRPLLSLPFSDSTIAKMDTFDAAYSSYLAGERKSNPSASIIGISAADARNKRLALRTRIAKQCSRAKA